MRSRRIITALLALLLLGGCSIEPILHLRKAIKTKVALATTVSVDVMWQVNWTATWQFNWNVAALGPLGYTLPASMRMHVFTHGPDGVPVTHFTYNFMGESTETEVFIGTHDLLFHNNDSESLLFRQEDDLADVHSYTRKVANGLKASVQVLTVAQKAEGKTKAEDELSEPVNLTPDGLFSLFDKDQVISDDLDNYVYENGKYVLKIEGELKPATFIYLFQITLKNNADRVVGSAGGAALTGMAQGVNLMDNVTWSETASYLTDVYMDKPQDMLGAKIFTFGIPGCNPYDDASVAASQSKHYLVVNISYVNGSTRNISMDVTEAIRSLPLGGVIPLEIDVDDFPPDESAGGGGGFQALIGDWDEKTGATTIIN